jgi:hypothetical protein
MQSLMRHKSTIILYVIAEDAAKSLSINNVT